MLCFLRLNILLLILTLSFAFWVAMLYFKQRAKSACQSEKITFGFMWDTDVVVLTEAKYINPKEVDWYTNQVLTEDGLVLEALNMNGLRAIKKSWDDKEFDWSKTQFVLFRTTWDYFNRFAEFDQWLNETQQKTQFINPIELIRWNLDKHYLNDLKKRGVNIPETLYLNAGEEQTLQSIHDKTGWSKTVLKPTVSGAARHTYLLTLNNLNDHEKIFSELIEKEDMMLQPFQENVIKKGEVSHMVFGGNYSHSVLKTAKRGDFRVQDDFGGSVQNYPATKKEIAFAEYTVSVCVPKPAYARVDVIKDDNGQLAVAELELIEPELWFRNKPEAATLLANVITKML